MNNAYLRFDLRSALSRSLRSRVFLFIQSSKASFATVAAITNKVIQKSMVCTCETIGANADATGPAI